MPIETQDFYTEYRPLLFSLAYRLVGTVMDAEDLVQETFIAYTGFDAEREASIENVRAYLCKMLTNRCIDFLRQAKHRREVYVGPWLPEPVVFREGHADHDPLQELLCRDDLSLAYLLLMETLTPTERAVFVLREAFLYDYEQIAELVGKAEANCRKIYSRVKQKLGSDLEDRRVDYEQDQKLLNRFLHAMSVGDTGTLLQLLAEDVMLLSDGGGRVSAAIRPVQSAAHVMAFLQGLVRKTSANSSMEIVTLNGQPGVLLLEGSDVIGTFSFERVGERIGTIYMIRNPEKLARIE